MGVTTTYGENARAAHASFNAQREAIEQDPDLTPEAKQRQISELRDKHRGEQQDRRAKEHEHLTARRSELIGSLFGVDRSNPGAVIGHRDAADRAERVRNQSEAQALIARATSNGDEQLAAAVAQRAADMNWAEAFSTWTATRPHTHAAVQELGDIDTLMDPRTNLTRSLTDFGGGYG